MDSIILERKTALVINDSDNVAVALTDFKKGDQCFVRFNKYEEVVIVLDDISFGHKFALCLIGKDESVLKYGEEIGKMSEPVEKGRFIHNHNMYCDRGIK